MNKLIVNVKREVERSSPLSRVVTLLLSLANTSPLSTAFLVLSLVCPLPWAYLLTSYLSLSFTALTSHLVYCLPTCWFLANGVEIDFVSLLSYCLLLLLISISIQWQWRGKWKLTSSSVSGQFADLTLDIHWYLSLSCFVSIRPGHTYMAHLFVICSSLAHGCYTYSNSKR